MKWTKRSIYSGIIREKELPITQEQIDQYESGIPLDLCMPNLSQADRTFFVSGITDEDWDEMEKDSSSVSVGDKLDK